MFELGHLRSFVAVAEELNFRRAARRLNMTQPPLSRQIALLEHAIGVRLFDRTNRSVRLTAAGKRFLPDAVDILTRADLAALQARQAERGEVGSVKLGFVPSASIYVVPRIAAGLKVLKPGVQLTLREMMTYEQIEALSAGTLDFGIFRLPARSPGLPIRKIWSEHFLLALPRDHRLALKEEVTVEDLDDEEFIGYSTERGGFLNDVVSGFLNGRGVAPRVVHAVAQSHTVMALVNEGLGVGLIPAATARIAMSDTVVREIDLPDDLRSDLYMGLGPKDPDPLTAEVATLIERLLADAKGPA